LVWKRHDTVVFAKSRRVICRRQGATEKEVAKGRKGGEEKRGGERGGERVCPHPKVNVK